MNRLPIALLLAVLMVVTPHLVFAQDVSAEAAARIAAACPAEAPAEPGEGRRLLVFTLCRGFVHDSIPLVSEALRTLGEKTAAWETVVSDDPEMLRPESLAGFDAICMNNTTGTLFEDEELKGSLLSYVREGGGLVGIHAATDCFYDWPEYGELIGAYFWGHPWSEEVGVKVDEPAHPLAGMFPEEGFRIGDEIYQFRAPYSREELRVLLSLETGETDMGKGGINRTDGDFAVSWVREYGQGRVFYCSLGHWKPVTWNPMVLRHYLAGVQYAMGDLEADATPSIYLEEGGWRKLFNGEDLTGWDRRPDGWHVEDGAIAWREGAGFLWSEERFGDFILDLEFKVSPGANSGVFVRTDSRSNWLHTGIEVQVLDSYGRQNPGRHDCGAIYDCLGPSVNAVKPAGEWNRMFILCRDNVIRVVLNGHPIIDMDLDQWAEAHRNPDGSGNKFNTAYADMAREGFIGFQDHGRPVSFRSIRIKPLTPR